jgi:Kelch motif protein
MSSAILAAAWSTAPDYTAAVSWYGQHDAAVVVAGGKKVLLAGGADAKSVSVRHSGLFDLDAGTWKTGQLGTARQLHALAVLPSGKVLVTGGISAPNTAALATTEIYDPDDNTWTAGPPMPAGRWGHSAVTLSNGTVLVAGGSAIRSSGTVKALTTALLFTETEDGGTWADAAPMTDARTGHAAVVLQAGKKVLVCGGSAPVGPADDPALAFCELYDTDTDAWTPTGSMRAPRVAHTATALSATTVLVAGGKAPGASSAGFDPFARSSAEVFDLGSAGGTWTPTDAMPAGRAYHRAVSLGGGKVLVIGGADDGADEAGYRGAVEYAGGGWTKSAGLIEGRWAFAAAASGAKVLVAGGVARTGLAAASEDVELTKTAERSGT